MLSVRALIIIATVITDIMELNIVLMLPALSMVEHVLTEPRTLGVVVAPFVKAKSPLVLTSHSNVGFKSSRTWSRSVPKPMLRSLSCMT